MPPRRLTRLLLVLALSLAGAWLLARPTGPAPDSAARQQSLRQRLAPAAGDPAGATAAGPYEPIMPTVVELGTIPTNVYDPNNLYDRWLQGAIDLDENEYRLSEAEVAALQAEALRLPPSPAVQMAVAGPSPSAPTPDLAFTSLDYSECCGGGASTPPDTHFAAGPDHLISVVNVALEIYDKSGNSLAGPTTFASFFASRPVCVAAPNGAFDPTVVYDEEADRWAIGVDGNGTHFCIAVSQSGDPTGAWNLYSVPAQPIGGEFHDYPHMGVGDDYIVVGANQFGGSIPSGFEGRVWALDKAAMYAGGSMTPISASVGYDGGTPQPLHLHGFAQGTWPDLGGEHYIATDFYNGCRTDIWSWSPPAAPAIVATLNLCTATGVTGGMPVNFPQLGGSLIQANDWRMRGFEYRNGSGWIADSISCNPGSGTVDCVRWTEVDLEAATPAIVQAGVYASNGSYRTFPDLAVNACGDMAIGYTRSSASEYPGIWVTGRLNTDPAGALGTEIQQVAGEVPYTGFDGVPRRWGDYSSMAIDPDGVTFWYLGEYSKNIVSPTKWGTHVGSYSFAGCVLAPVVSANPTSWAVVQPPDSVITLPLTISNTGTLALNWTLVEAPALAGPGGPCDVPADVAWLATDPVTGTTPVGGGTPVDVVVDSTGLSDGDYGATLCLNSDDPATPQIQLPLTLTVDADTYAAELGGDTYGLGAPGEDIVFSLVLTNTGTAADTYTLGASSFEWPASVAPGAIGLASGAAAAITVTVTVPEGTAAGNVDLITVTATSQGQPATSATRYLLAEAAAAYGAALSADQAATGLPGDTVTYTLAFTNTGNAPDTFDLAYAGSWSGTVTPTVAPLGPGEATVVSVSVDVPGGAAAGDDDAATVTATSGTDPLATDSAVLTTTAGAVYALSMAGDQAGLAAPGGVVTYTLVITNAGNAADTFTLSVNGNGWSTGVAPTNLPLAAGASGAVVVTVSVPNGTADGLADVATITAVSTGDGAVQASVTLTTTSSWPRLYLPTLLRP